MYWFRDGSALSLLPWLLALLGLWLGGWLLATHAFRLASRERLIVGLGLGLVLYTWFANLLGQWLAPSISFAFAAALLSLIGIVFAWRRKEGSWLDREDLSVWPWLVVGLGLVWLFLLWGKGLALFDEHKNLSLISMIANGDIPPHFIPNYPLRFIYHYGFQVFGASLLQLGGMLPWSAFDTGKAVLWGETLLLAALLGRRYIGHAWGALLGAGVIALASGTRYLLLLLPPSFLLYADRFIQLQGTSALIGKPFSDALISGWPVDGGPPMAYMFGFLNGIMEPMVMAHQGPNTFSVLILLLLWLLLSQLANRWSTLILVAIFSMWALAWEASYGLFMLGLFAFAALYWWRERTLNLPYLKPALIAALVSIPVVLLQGGTFTELARDLIFGIERAPLFGAVPLLNLAGAGISLVSPASSLLGLDIFGFTLRWPPAIPSSHLGALNIFSPAELIVGVFEIGPVLLFTPWITRWAWRRARSGDWALGALIAAAWIGFMIPLFLQYEADRDISRLMWQALLTWTLMLAFVVGDESFRWKAIIRPAAIIGLALMLFGGLMVAGIQLSAASKTQLAHGYNELDAAISAEVWGKIPNEARVFGQLGHTTILSGRLTGQLLGEAPEGSQWQQLFAAPNLDSLVALGYDFILIDSRWWDDLSPEMQLASGFDAACVETFAEVWDNSHVNFRRMLDLRACN